MIGVVPVAVRVNEFAWPVVKVAADALVNVGACANALAANAMTRPTKPNRRAMRRPRPTNEYILGELCFMIKNRIQFSQTPEGLQEMKECPGDGREGKT